MATDSIATAMIGGGIIAAFMAFLAAYFLFVAAIYVYSSFAYMSIAKKLKYDKPWLAWIPIVNIFMMAQLAGNPWYYGFLVLIPFVNIAVMVIWTWKIFEARKYSGAFSLLPIVPILGTLAFFVVLGFVAWKDK